MATKRKRGESWEYIVRRKGLLPKPLSMTFSDEKEGDAYVSHLEKLLDSGIVPSEFKERAAAITTLGKAIAQYLDAVHVTAEDVALLNALHAQVGGRGMDRVDYAWAEQWVKELQASGISPSTIRKKVGALARCLDWVERRNGTMMGINPLRRLPKRYATTSDGPRDEERDRRLHDGEEQKILAILNREKPEGRERPLALPHADALKLMFTLALETAMRMRETYTLTRDQVDIKQRTIFLDKTKNGQERRVPLSSVALAALTDYLKTLAGDRLFPFWDGDYSPKALRMTTAKLSQQWSRIFGAAQCDNLHYHDLRRESISRFFERTKLSEIEIAKVVGHSSTKMLMRYTSLRASDLADKLW